MIRGLRPLLRGSTYTGVLFAYAGALASLPLLPFALAPALAWRSAPEAVQIVLVLLLWAVLIVSVGLARTTRRVLVVAARRLLRVPLPDPVAGRRRPGTAAGPSAAPGAAPSGAGRWRTPLWLLLHVLLGWTGALVSGLLILLGLSLPGNRLGGQVELNLFGRPLRVEGGWQSWVLALGCLLLAAAACAAVTGALRWTAPRLLGPSPAERLALAAERELLLAERNRLAKELHDSIGHTLTAATIQAAVAGEVLAADPAAARAAMRSIEESARAALEDLDYVLGVLREEEPGTAPARTLNDLPELLDRLRHAGAVVEPDLSGDLAQVQGTLSRAAYRILQEGLTNALRHGAGGPVEVRVAAGADGLELSVVNRTGAAPGTGPGAFPSTGRGLPGLAERVRLLHGEIDFGPAGPRHWRLAVRLPVRLPA
ncbi:two-component sensor histidine kinase [Kitasatospora herbaricolor]|uniref:sensor histidine kinase n=1 Tax=Kitasatospora herbaricolor TaxID=68217 RepID=UPI00174E6B3C|nr:histidine kinase [Kitasatospora herbaricolor]MDQ0307130.1 signal transduction histidine kinase [Kitasatospora herbaricolor]GGV29149.1 two-component sensor histidine kinase [Kitasatospora herbaricolor]